MDLDFLKMNKINGKKYHNYQKQNLNSNAKQNAFNQHKMINKNKTKKKQITRIKKRKSKKNRKLTFIKKLKKLRKPEMLWKTMRKNNYIFKVLK